MGFLDLYCELYLDLRQDIGYIRIVSSCSGPDDPTAGGGGMRVETRRVLAEGVWQVVFVVFLAYAMMPLKTWVAALFGLFLPIVHIIVAAIFAKEFPSLTWQQVCI